MNGDRPIGNGFHTQRRLRWHASCGSARTFGKTNA